MESVANWRAAFNGKLGLQTLCGEWGDGKVARGDCRVEPEMQKLGWPLGSMDGRGNAGGGWRGGERNCSWTGQLARMPGELMETLH